jgi:hypothetical protein
MCMEDYRIERQFETRESYTDGGAGPKILPGDGSRVGLAVYLGFETTCDIYLVGRLGQKIIIRLDNVTPYKYFDLKELGQLMYGPFIIADAGGGVGCLIVETLLLER